MSDSHTLELGPAPPEIKKKKTFAADASYQSGILYAAVLLLIYVVCFYVIGPLGERYLFVPLMLTMLFFLVYPFAVGKSLAAQVMRRMKRGQYESVQTSIKKTGSKCVTSGILVALLPGIASVPLMTGLYRLENGYLPVIPALLSILLFSTHAVQTGFLGGMGETKKVVIADALRIALSLVLSPSLGILFAEYGEKTDALLHTTKGRSLYGALGVSCGLFLAVLISGCYLLIAYRRRLKRTTEFEEDSVRTDILDVGVKSTAVPFSFAAAFLPLLLLVTYAVVPLETDGFSSGATAFFIAILLTVFFVRSAYRLSVLAERQDIMNARPLFQNVRFFYSFYALFLSAMVIALAETLCRLLFPASFEAFVVPLRLYAPAILFLPMILFGMIFLLRIRKSAVLYFNMAVSTLLHAAALIVCRTFLSEKTSNCAGIAFLFSFGAFFFLTLMELSVMTGVRLKFMRDVFKKLVAVLVAAGIAYLLNGILVTVIGEALTLIVSLAVGAFLYLFLLMVLRGIRVSQLYHLPFGDALVKVARLMRLKS